MATLLYTHDIFKDHLVPAGHPERPDRIKAVEQALSASQFDGLIRRSAPKADTNTYLYADSMRCKIFIFIALLLSVISALGLLYWPDGLPIVYACLRPQRLLLKCYDYQDPLGHTFYQRPRGRYIHQA